MKKKSRGKRIITLLSAFILTATFLFGTFTFIERKILYPLGYKTEIFAAADGYGLERAFIFAVVKTESGFNKDAVSRKNAKGLMQITDSTGAYIAYLKGVEEYDLRDYRVNLDFGCFYLKYLFNKFKDKKTALCAYNAGEGTVERWLNSGAYSPDGITLSLVPYKETDNYVKKIIEYEKKYKKLYGNILDKNK